MSTMTINNLNYEETWSLDETGNWREYQQDTDGNGTWDLIQSRTSNKVNEITDITETVGNAWTTPVYHKSGNMTTIPTPNDPTVSYTATYDAWNRLVKLTDGSNTITEYQYDGLRRRVIHKVYNTGVLNHTKHLYYNANWQLLEERRDSNTSPTKQQIWGNRYIDDLVLRDHDTDDNGTLNERLYALQDANWNVTSYVNESGTAQERYIYNAYGSVTLLDANFGVISSSTIEPDHLYAGYNYDSDVDMYHVRNRGYHPMLGTWLQRDPIGYDGGDMSLYGYCSQIPIHSNDSTGLICKPKRYTCREKFFPQYEPIGKKKELGTCMLSVVQRPIRGDKTDTLGHLYLLVHGPEFTYVISGGPDDNKTRKFLLTTIFKWDKEANAPDWPKTDKEEKQHIANRYTINMKCIDLYCCLRSVGVAVRLNKVPYKAIPQKKAISGNSNSLVRWMLEKCAKKKVLKGNTWLNTPIKEFKNDIPYPPTGILPRSNIGFGIPLPAVIRTSAESILYD